MRILVLQFLVFFIAVSSAIAEEALTIAIPEKAGPPLISISVLGRAPSRAETHKLIGELKNAGADEGEIKDALSKNTAAAFRPVLLLAIWQDGSVLKLEGTEEEPSYLQLVMKPEDVQALIGEIRDTTKGIPQNWLNSAVQIPDSPYLNILVRESPGEAPFLFMDSAHEIIEAGPGYLGAHGLFVVEPERREEVLRTEPIEYQRFREVWREVRELSEAATSNAKQTGSGLELAFDHELIDLPYTRVAMPALALEEAQGQ